MEQEIGHRSRFRAVGIRSQIICDELVGDKAVFLQQFSHQFERRPLVAHGLDQNVEHLTLGIHGQATIDIEIDFVECQMVCGFGWRCEDRLKNYPH